VFGGLELVEAVGEAGFMAEGEQLGLGEDGGEVG
jgi:hypothetical protein